MRDFTLSATGEETSVSIMIQLDCCFVLKPYEYLKHVRYVCKPLGSASTSNSSLFDASKRHRTELNNAGLYVIAMRMISATYTNQTKHY